MKKKYYICGFIFPLILISCSSHFVFQDPVKNPSEISIFEMKLIQEGTKAFDQGNYEKAVIRYKEILDLYPDNVRAIYGLALAYSAMNRHQQSLETAMLAAQYKWPELNKVYGLIGSELNYLGENKNAVEFCQDVIKQYPDESLLYYDLGYAYNSCDKIEDAKAALKTSIYLNPSYAGSHLALARSFMKEGNKIPALFAYCRFLILECTGEQADSARNDIRRIIAGNARTNPKNPNEIKISADLDDPESEGNFKSMNFFLSMNSALQMTLLKDKRSVRERNIDIFEGMFSMGMADSVKDNKPLFIRQYYIPYFQELNRRNFTRTFVDYAIFEIKDTTDKVEGLLNWSNNYKWPEKNKKP